MKNLSSQKLLVVCLLIVIMFSLQRCSQLIEDHPCCKPEQAAVKTAEKNLEDANKQLNTFINLLNEDVPKLNQRMSNLNNNLRFFLNGLNTPASRSLLQTFIDRFQEDLGHVNNHITFIFQSIELRWSRKEALNAANVNYVACVKANCIPRDTCCPAEKKAEHAAQLALELQDFKIADYDMLLSLLQPVQNNAQAQTDVAIATLAEKCPPGTLVGSCFIASTVVNMYKSHLASITSTINGVKKAKEQHVTQRAILELDYNLKKQIRLNCELVCPK